MRHSLNLAQRGDANSFQHIRLVPAPAMEVKHEDKSVSERRE